MGGEKSITAAGPIGRCLLRAAAQRIQPAEGNGTAHTVPGQSISTQPLKMPSKCSPGLRESCHFSCTQVQIFKSLPYNWVASFPTPGLTAAWWNAPHAVIFCCQYSLQLQSSTKLEHEDVFQDNLPFCFAFWSADSSCKHFWCWYTLLPDWPLSKWDCFLRYTTPWGSTAKTELLRHWNLSYHTLHIITDMLLGAQPFHFTAFLSCGVKISSNPFLLSLPCLTCLQPVFIGWPFATDPI